MVKTDGSTRRAIAAQSGWASMAPWSELTWVRKPSRDCSCALIVVIAAPTPATPTARTTTTAKPAMIDETRSERSRVIPRATGRFRISVRTPASVARLRAIDAMPWLDEARPERCLSLREAQHCRVQLLEAFLD